MYVDSRSFLKVGFEIPRLFGISVVSHVTVEAATRFTLVKVDSPRDAHTPLDLDPWLITRYICIRSELFLEQVSFPTYEINLPGFYRLRIRISLQKKKENFAYHS